MSYDRFLYNFLETECLLRISSWILNSQRFRSLLLKPLGRSLFWESGQNTVNYILKFGKAPITQRCEEGEATYIAYGALSGAISSRNASSAFLPHQPAMTCLNQPSSSPAESDWPHDNPNNDDRQQRYALVFATEKPCPQRNRYF